MLNIRDRPIHIGTHKFSYGKQLPRYNACHLRILDHCRPLENNRTIQSAGLKFEDVTGTTISEKLG
jgi:hypothetical protein